MKLHLDILPKTQQSIYHRLGGLPDGMVLYGGTALALQLGHRKSIDFDFFTDKSLQKKAILSQDLFIESQIIQDDLDTLSLVTSNGVKLSFFGSINFVSNPLEPHLRTNGKLHIASIKDIFSTKCKTILDRPFCKDYIDIAAILKMTKLRISDGIGGAKILYPNYNELLFFKALTYFKDGDLSQLPEETKSYLKSVVKKETDKFYER